ncbi:IclR family transcriptional regulator [Bacillus sp. 166amftsu]|uniref:IclR family transcriptional regulator n=1 Tax=Bacillus sp. 166amftsu TaxID=1761753 RepID=UPI000898B05D|nr:IclR family transcriptional regulator [Bacillus sp. 166amftsu]SDY95164.1 DNA-binding transcriptional regulator, IclR family [Bacillus sp. 166amftsu]
MEKVKNGSTIQSLQIGMGILDVIAKQERPLKFADIQELTQITKSNLYKYLNTFVQLNVLYRDKDSGTYVLGSKLINYGMIAADQENVLDRITPFLEELNQKSSCSIIYSIWTPSGPMVIKMFNNNLGFNIGAQVGTLLPLTSSASKIFLAFQDAPIIHEWKERESKRMLPHQLTQLEEEIQLIRDKEIAFATEPIIASVSSVSFPIFNYKKNLLASVAVVGFSEQIPTNDKQDLSKYILEVSRGISGVLGYQSS